MCGNLIVAYVGEGNLTVLYFVGMDRFPKFDMVVEAPVLLKMWYNDLNAFHKRDLNKYVGP